MNEFPHGLHDQCASYTRLHCTLMISQNVTQGVQKTPILILILFLKLKQ